MMSSSSGTLRYPIVAARGVVRVRPRRRREVPQVGPDQVEGGGVVGCHVVDQPAGHGDPGPAQVLLADLLAQRLGDHRGAGGEDGGVRAHHREVGHGGHQRAVAGRGAEDGGHHRHPARAGRLGQEVGGGTGMGLAVGPEPGPLQHHHQRAPGRSGRSRRPGSAWRWPPS